MVLKIKKYLLKITKTLYQHKYDFHFVRKLEWKIVKKFLNPQKRDIILDLACGNGFFTQKLTNDGCYVIGIDIDKKKIQYANYYHKVNGCEFKVGNAESMPLRSATFDKVFSISSLQHFNNPGKALREINRVLRKHGRVVISVDSFSYHKVKKDFKEWHRDNFCVVNYFKLSDLKKMIENAGFSLKASKYLLSSYIAHIFYKWAIKRGCTGVFFLLSFPFVYLSILVSDRLFKRKDEGYILIVSAEKNKS